jgi:hypothetical protein
LQSHCTVNRNRIMAVLAAIVIPGGLVVLFGALIYQALLGTERGKRAIEAVRRTAPAWAAHTRWRSPRLAA